MYVISNDSRIGQGIAIAFTSFILLGSIIQSFNGNKTFLLLIIVASVFTNWIASRNHYIYIKENKINIESLYSKRRVYDSNLFLKIEVIIPGQNYYFIYLKNGKRYSFARTNNRDIITYFKSDKGIIDEMNQGIQQELSKK